MFGSFSSCRHVRVSWWCCWCKLCIVYFPIFNSVLLRTITCLWRDCGVTSTWSDFSDRNYLCYWKLFSLLHPRSPVLLQEISPAFNKYPFLTALCLKEMKSCLLCVAGYKDSKTAERQRTSSCQHVAVRPRRWRRRSFVSAQCGCLV